MLPVCVAVTERKSIQTVLCLCVSELEVFIVNSRIDVSLVAEKLNSNSEEQKQYRNQLTLAICANTCNHAYMYTHVHTHTHTHTQHTYTTHTHTHTDTHTHTHTHTQPPPHLLFSPKPRCLAFLISLYMMMPWSRVQPEMLRSEPTEEGERGGRDKKTEEVK